MIEKSYKITSINGIHARSAAVLVKEASKFSADITLCLNNVCVDFKSIMGVMSLGIYKNEIVKIICVGSDEVEAIKHLDNVIHELNIGKEY